MQLESNENKCNTRKTHTQAQCSGKHRNHALDWTALQLTRFCQYESSECRSRALSLMIHFPPSLFASSSHNGCTTRRKQVQDTASGRLGQGHTCGPGHRQKVTQRNHTSRAASAEEDYPRVHLDARL